MIKINEMVTMMEAKKKNRWVTTFPAIFNIEQFVINTTSRPTLELTDEVNGSTYKICDYKWLPITISFIDPIGPSTSDKLMQISNGLLGINDNVELIETLKNGFTYKLELLDPVGAVIETWTISGCEIKKIIFGDLDYSNSEPLECKMIIQPKEVKLT